MKYVHYVKKQLFLESISLKEISKQIDTPFYCYSSNKILKQYKLFEKSLSQMNSMICYAIKANSNQAILRLLSLEGSGADVVSAGELKRALSAGIPAKKIVFSGVGKKETEIIFALKQKIYCFNVESEEEINCIANCASILGMIAPISLRINPDIDAKTHRKITTGKSENKFGIPLSHALNLYQKIATIKSLKIKGIAMHIGSQITEPTPFEKAFLALRNVIHQLLEKGIILEYVDVGGGLGVSYFNQKTHLSIQEYANIVKEHIQPLKLKVIFEPGRFLVAEAGVLVTKVLYIKKGQNKNFVIVDAGMNDFMRPTLYDAEHDILFVENSTEMQEYRLSDVVGPVCETGDYFALNRNLPSLNAGALLAIKTTGAYGAVMSNDYNSRELIPEVLVRDDKFSVIRKRISINKIIGRDSIPDWLK